MNLILDESNIDQLLDQQTDLWESGQRPSIIALLGNISSSQRDDVCLDLIYNEVVLREGIGEHPSLEEYIAAFPELANALTAQFEVHRAISDGLLIDTQKNSPDETHPSPDASRSLNVTESIAGYEILREIGRGGFAIVYQARQQSLRRDVAIKMFQPGRIPSRRELQRFRSEATAVARLNHPNIVQIFEIGEWAGVPYLALELIDGGTLARKLERALLAPKAAAQLIEKLARAIQHAHDRGVIHRDLKPANVLFDVTDEPKVADFGLAKLLESEERSWEATRTGEPIGTPRYMSPEQAGGQTANIGKSSDIYSLGVLLYECLTGQAPFVASSVIETLKKIGGDEPLSPRRLQPSIPRDLATICLHCLQKNPLRRYQSAEELANDLKRFQQGKAIHAKPTPQWERLWKTCRRHPAEAILIALATLVVVGGFGWINYSSAKERTRIKDLRAQVIQLTNTGRDQAEEHNYDQAQEHLSQAWKLVQGEPSLSDLSLGVEGWFDHCQRAASVQLWQGRVPPRDFDQLRDDAVVDSLLIGSRSPEAITQAREAIDRARQMTEGNQTIDSLAWRPERELLDLIETDLIASTSDSVRAREFLSSAGEYSSRLYWQRMSELCPPEEAKTLDKATLNAKQFPQDPLNTAWLAGINLLRQQQYASSLDELQRVLDLQPTHFAARLLQGICLVKLDRCAEAKIALTACVGQRPLSAWSYYWRAMAYRGLNDHSAAALDLQRVTQLKSSPTLLFLVDQYESSNGNLSQKSN